MPLADLFQTIEESWVGTGIRESLWVYPILHAVHILGNTLMFGSIVFLDLRLLGAGLTKRRVSDVAEQLLPWTWAGWSIMFVSGALIFTSDAVRYASNGWFRAKMLLMILAAINALVFHKTIYRQVDEWGSHAGTPARARLAGGVSLATWLAIIVIAREIGYSAF